MASGHGLTGVRWSGMAADIVRPRSEEEIMEAARAALQRQEEFRATPQSRLLAALSQGQGALEDIRACYSRGFSKDELDRAYAHVADAMAAVQSAQAALNEISLGVK